MKLRGYFANQVGRSTCPRGSGIDFVGKPTGYGLQKRKEFDTKFYHTPQDEIQPGWDLSGAVQDLRLFLAMGYRVARASVRIAPCGVRSPSSKNICIAMLRSPGWRSSVT